MAGNVKVRIKGLKQAMRRVRQLSEAGQRAALEPAMTKAAQPLIRSAQGRAPSRVIAEGIQVVNVVIKSKSGIRLEVGLPGGRKPWFHGLFVELGTGPRVQKTTGRRTGSMPADPFLRPAFDAEKNNVRNIFAAELRRRLGMAARG